MQNFINKTIDQMWDMKKQAIFDHYLKLVNDEVDLEKEAKEHKERLENDRKMRIEQVNSQFPTTLEQVPEDFQESEQTEEVKI